MTSTTFFFIFIPILGIILLLVNFILAPHNPYQEKDSVFECGFHSFLGQNRTQFSVSFFIFALLFLLFDLEILLVYPYIVSGYTNDVYGLIIMLGFFVLLTLGFAFELGKKALKIDSRQNDKNPKRGNSNKDTICRASFSSTVVISAVISCAGSTICLYCSSNIIENISGNLGHIAAAWEYVPELNLMPLLEHIFKYPQFSESLIKTLLESFTNVHPRPGPFDMNIPDLFKYIPQGLDLNDLSSVVNSIPQGLDLRNINDLSSVDWGRFNQHGYDCTKPNIDLPLNWAWSVLPRLIELLPPLSSLIPAFIALVALFWYLVWWKLWLLILLLANWAWLRIFGIFLSSILRYCVAISDLVKIAIFLLPAIKLYIGWSLIWYLLTGDPFYFTIIPYPWILHDNFLWWIIHDLVNLFDNIEDFFRDYMVAYEGEQDVMEDPLYQALRRLKIHIMRLVRRLEGWSRNLMDGPHDFIYYRPEDHDDE